METKEARKKTLNNFESSIKRTSIPSTLDPHRKMTWFQFFTVIFFVQLQPLKFLGNNKITLKVNFLLLEYFLQK